MRLGHHAIELIERMRRANTSAAITNILKLSLAPHGVASILVAGLPDPPGNFAQHFLIDGTCAAWRSHYSREDYYRDDPVPTVTRKSFAPFEWSDNWFTSLAGVAKRPRAAQVLRDAAEFGLKSGYAVPIVRPSGFHAAAFFNGERLNPDPRVRHVMYLAGLYAHARVYELRVRENARKTTSTCLTDREREALRWTAAGKTSWEISILFGVSENAVNRCILSAATKLDAVNRTQAVVNAIRLGVISL